MRVTSKCIPAFFVFAMLVFSCTDESSETPEVEIPENEDSLACTSEGLLENFTDSDGNNIHIYEDGKLFIQKDGSCQFELQYFEPDFLTQNYITNADGTFIVDDETLIPVVNNFQENFDAKQDLTELFVADPLSPDLFWTNMTLQSPMAKEVSDYVPLAKCILEGTCDFLDNRISLVEDSVDSNNMVLKFESVTPTADMVTSKSSLISVLGYFQKGDDLWFEADYFIESGMPFTIVDFESSYFFGSPGPRIVITNGRLAFENKFGTKKKETPSSDIAVPNGTWFTVKVHLKYSNTADGVIELWQDGVQLLNTTGINLPTSNTLLNKVEVGISASQEGTVLLMDNLRISDSEF